MSEFILFKDVVKGPSPAKAVGELIILWVSTYAPNAHNDAAPYSGLALFGGRSVLFFMSDAEKTYAEAQYDLYDMSPESRKLVEDDHKRFQEVVGYTRDYGPERLKTYERKYQAMNFYQHGYDIGQLEVNFLGQADSGQIKNRYPHSPVE
jgi:hypothetical protein